MDCVRNMLKADASNIDEAAELISEACARNLPAEIFRADATPGTDTEELPARARMLGIDGEEILMEPPLVQGIPTPPPRGVSILVHFQIHGNRYCFRSSVVRRRCGFALNSRTTVPAMTLARPREVVKMQRRGHFRVSVASQHIGVRCIKAHQTLPAVCKLHRCEMRGKMRDVSIAGLSIIVEEADARKRKVGDHWFLEFGIEDGRPPEILFAVVRHIRFIPERQTALLGMAFRDWEDPESSRRNADIRHFAAEIERRNAGNRKNSI